MGLDCSTSGILTIFESLSCNSYSKSFYDEFSVVQTHAISAIIVIIQREFYGNSIARRRG